MGVARSMEEAAAFAKVLDDAGVILLFRDRVYLHPDKGSSASERYPIGLPVSTSASVQESEADGHSIYVKGLPLNAMPVQLEEEFKRFGPIKPGGIQVRSHKQQGFCFGFIEFETLAAVQSAIEFKRLAEIVAAVYSEDKYIQLKAMTLFKKMLSKGKQQTVDDRTFYLLDFSEDIMKYGVVPRFVEFLARDDFPQLQFEAASALINITSGTTEDTQVVVDLGAVPIFVELLLSNSDDVKEMAVCALGNVAGDSPRFRDFVLANGALLPVLHLLNEDAKLSMLRTASLTLYNFFSGEPQPDFEETRPALPVLKCLIQLEDETVLGLACWALCCLSGGTNDQIQAVMDAGVCPKLVELLLHSSLFVVKPVLLTVISIVRGDGAQAVIDAGIIARLVQLLETNIKTEAIMVISNAASRGSFEHIMTLTLTCWIMH